MLDFSILKNQAFFLYFFLRLNFKKNKHRTFIVQNAELFFSLKSLTAHIHRLKLRCEKREY